MPDTPHRYHFVADRGDARLRLDQVLVRRVSPVARLSRNVAQQWIDAGAVELDGRVATRASASVREGSAVAVAVPNAQMRTRPAAEAGALAILYEDQSLIAINKPPGTVVHPSYKQAAGTLLNALLWHLRDRPGLTPGILTRLDKDTSGVVLVALTPGVHAALQRDAAAGRITKQYLALVAGVPRPRSGRITLPLARDPADRRRVIPLASGAASETRYEVVSPPGRIRPATSLVRCELVTGRTHQIRVHLSARGWPIVGDRVYGAPHAQLARQALHAWRIALPHPVTREPLVIEASLPDDMAALLPGPL
jgi:23S rRNA pseudouridine1911/1915/1917 synthase